LVRLWKACTGADWIVRLHNLCSLAIRIRKFDAVEALCPGTALIAGTRFTNTFSFVTGGNSLIHITSQRVEFGDSCNTCLLECEAFRTDETRVIGAEWFTLAKNIIGAYCLPM